MVAFVFLFFEFKQSVLFLTFAWVYVSLFVSFSSRTLTRFLFCSPFDQGLLFEFFSPFDCGTGTEKDIVSSRHDVEFLSFVSQCAATALCFVSAEEERGFWLKVQKHPETPPKLKSEQLAVAWRAVCDWLSTTTPTQLKIWTLVAGRLELEYSFGLEGTRVLEFIKWNTKVSCRIDLLIPSETSKLWFDDLPF